MEQGPMGRNIPPQDARQNARNRVAGKMAGSGHGGILPHYPDSRKAETTQACQLTPHRRATTRRGMQRGRTSRALWLLLAAAVFMRALVPAGWMPDTSRSDMLVVTVCNGGYQVAIPLDREDAPSGDEEGHHEAPCLFAGFASDAPLGNADLPLVAAAPAQQVESATPAPFLLAPNPRLTPPLRGPPALS